MIKIFFECTGTFLDVPLTCDMFGTSSHIGIILHHNYLLCISIIILVLIHFGDADDVEYKQHSNSPEPSPTPGT